MLTQIELILLHMRTHGSITPLDAQSEYGIMRLGARIWDARKAGHNIVEETVAVKNRFGKICHVARYRLAAGAGQAEDAHLQTAIAKAETTAPAPFNPVLSEDAVRVGENLEMSLT
jgi:hypothetical protein